MRERTIALDKDFHRYWWRWRESNPRPKIPPIGVYKLSVAF